MNSFLTALAILALMLSLGCSQQQQQAADSTDSPKPSETQQDREEPPQAVVTPNTPPTQPVPSPPENPAITAIQRSLFKLNAREKRSPEITVELAKLSADLQRLDSPIAVEGIITFLQGTQDFATGFDLKFAKKGQIERYPSLRVFLLDRLATISPNDSLPPSRAILQHMNSSDEWAIALRNIAKHQTDPKARVYLMGKLEQLLQHTPWINDPSAAYLETFDLAVYLEATELVPLLATHLRNKNNRAVAHASYLVLDRLVIRAPRKTLEILLNDPSHMKGREGTQGNLFARADVRDPMQRALVEGYMLNHPRTPEELSALSGVYPNNNYMISRNMLTSPNTPTGYQLSKHDREAYPIVRQWLEDPRFQGVRSAVETMVNRLQEFIRQADSSKPKQSPAPERARMNPLPVL